MDLNKTYKFMNNDTNYKYYPSITNQNFVSKLIGKKEFIQSKNKQQVSDNIDQYNKLVKANCSLRDFIMMPQQEFLYNFISPKTPYNGVIIFHGTGVGKTCTSISIAENLMDSGYWNKTYVILPPRVKENYTNEIFSSYKYKKGISACTGTKYYPRYHTKEKLMKSEVIKKITDRYELIPYITFSNKMDNLKKKYKNAYGGTDTEIVKKVVEQNFSNIILIIDEAHNLRESEISKNLPQKDTTSQPKIDLKTCTNDASCGGKQALKPIMDIVKWGKNNKLLLMSATPMYDNPREIITLLNLLRYNDLPQPRTIEMINNVEIKPKEYFKDGKLLKDKEDDFKDLIRGYISYVKGGNPYIYPYIIDMNSDKNPDILFNNSQLGSQSGTQLGSQSGTQLGSQSGAQSDSQSNSQSRIKVNSGNYIYKPSPMYKIGSDPEDPEKRTLLANDRITHLNLIKCEMNNEFQYTLYKRYLPKKMRSETALSALYSSMIAFPINPKLGNLNVPKEENYKNTFRIRQSVSPNKKDHSFKMYEYNDDIRKNDFLKDENLSKYSTKMSSIFRNINSYEGIHFIYSFYISSSLLPMVLILERNGYKNYNDKNIYIHATKIKLRCICGKLKDDEEEEEPENRCKCKKFIQAKYVLFSGSTDSNMMKVIQKISRPENKNGESIKVVLGSQVVGEGIDFKNIRIVHIMESWYNMARLDQVIGRAVRTCSHIELPYENRGVRVLMYCSTVPSTIEQRKTVETIDEAMYRYSEQKDKNIKQIEILLIKLSVDCILHKEFNIRDYNNLKTYLPDEVSQKYKTKDGSRECNYSKCNYKCDVNFDDLINNESTYTIESSKIKLQTLEKKIVNLYKHNFVLTENQIDLAINGDKKYNSNTIKYIIEKIINNKRFVKDAYRRKGRIIKIKDIHDPYPYYIFQPNSIKDIRVPLKYRMMPMMRHTKILNIDKYSENRKPNTQSGPNSMSYIMEIKKQLDEINDSVSITYKVGKNTHTININDFIPKINRENRDKAIYQMKIDRNIYNPKIDMDRLLNHARTYNDNKDKNDKIYSSSHINLFANIKEYLKFVKDKKISDTILDIERKRSVLNITSDDIHNKKPYGIAGYQDKRFIFKILIPNKKGSSSGTNCSTIKNEELIRINQSLEINIIFDNIKKNLQIDNIILTKEMECNIREYRLRELDITNKKQERRFVNIYEKYQKK